jgi:ribosome recycling factor
MIRGIIYDRLLDQTMQTKPCKTEEEARKESIKKIERLCMYYKISVSDTRFELQCLEISNH